MKIKDIPGLKQQVISMLPVTQAEMWKVLGISSKDASELIGHMLGNKLIKRTRIKINGKWTFLLESTNGNGRASKIDFSVLFSGNKFLPCCGCEEVCEPVKCTKLKEWIIIA